MSQSLTSPAFVRTEEAPSLPPPPGMTGLRRTLRENYFGSFGSGVVTVVLSAVILWLVWRFLGFGLVNAVWTGEGREACLAADGQKVGACWPFIGDRFSQWIYGFYPIDQRWRINLCFAAFAVGLAPMLIPRLTYKNANAFYLFIVVPLVTLVLMTGGNFGFTRATYFGVICVGFLLATILPFIAFGMKEGMARNRFGVACAGAGLLVWVSSFAMGPGYALFAGALLILSGLLSLAVVGMNQAARTSRGLKLWGVLLAGVVAALAILDVDFGLVPVETAKWGGLNVTMIVSITGIAASLPIGIALALGRPSAMPAIRTLSVIFIEVVRGVPLITVLFMASFMLPLFLPPGMNFDKLMRALVGVALFSSAYMAEVVRGGLQAIPKGQHEGAMALGLSYWQMMTRIILPQALKIAIPNIVSTFIALFKDTTLVLIIGLFDLLGIAQASMRDPNWATPVTAPTGYLVLALIYWAFCFSMSRYALFTERRLNTGIRR